MEHVKQNKTQLFRKRNLAALMFAIAAAHGANAQTQSDTSGESQTQANASAQTSLQARGGANVDTNAIVDSVRTAGNATVNATLPLAMVSASTLLAVSVVESAVDSAELSTLA